MLWNNLPLSEYVGKYIKFTPPSEWKDYHDVRYGRVYDVREEDYTVLATSYYDAFTGEEEVIVPLKCILQVATEYRLLG